MKILVLSAILFITQASFAQDAAIRNKHFNVAGGAAISGYDPVSYFTENKAVKGNKEITFTYEGIVYHFSTAANRDEFKKNPAKYEPQYGGWCAFAMGKNGEKVEVDPGTFKIIDGRLFLFYNQFFNNTLKSWNKDEVNLHRSADRNCQKLFH